jgi:hypothetical protein
MSHFAKLDENNVVIFVTRGRQEDDGLEAELSERTGDIYKQTSYNTQGGVHYTNGQPGADQSKAFRKNFAGIGYTYDPDLDAFIPPQPYPSWLLDEDSCTWFAPVPMPNTGAKFEWDETAGAWVEVEDEAV